MGVINSPLVEGGVFSEEANKKEVTVNGVNSNNPTSVNYNNSIKKTDFSFLKICLFCKYFYIIHFFHALPELTIYKNILSIIYLRSV